MLMPGFTRIKYLSVKNVVKHSRQAELILLTGDVVTNVRWHGNKILH